MPIYTRAIVVRHYKTLFNADRRIMGWRDAPGADGWAEDARGISAILHERIGRLDAICSSSLERARNTAGYFAQEFDVSVVDTADDLREVNYGSLYGKTKQWVAENVPLHKKDPDFVYPEGESFRQMQERSVRYFRSLPDRYRGQTVLVVVHAGVIRGLVSGLIGLDFSANLRRKISHRYIGEFILHDQACARYDELGKPSGFVRDGVLELPFGRSPRSVMLSRGLAAEKHRGSSGTLDERAPS